MAKKQPGGGKQQVGPANRLLPEAKPSAPERDTAPFVHLNWEQPKSLKETGDIYAKPESYGEPHTRLREEVPASVRRMLRPQPAPLADAEWTLRDGRGISEVLAELRHGEWPVRYAALHSLCRLLDEAEALRPAILPVLAEMLASSDLDQLLSAATILQKLGPVAAPLVPVAIQVFDSTDEFVRLNVFDPLATALGRMGPAACEAGPKLFRLLKRDNYRPNQYAAQLALLRIHGFSEDDKWLYEIIGYSKNYQSFVSELKRRGFLADPNDISPPERGQQTPADARPQYLEALLATVPKDAPYEEQAQQLEGLSHELKRVTAVRILPALKAEMGQRPNQTLDDKKEVVKWVNGELRRFGFAIKHPKTGLAATLVADKGNHPEEGRFQLRGEGEDGKVETFSTPKLSVLLDTIELMEANPRREAILEWRDRIGKQGRGGASRA